MMYQQQFYSVFLIQKGHNFHSLTLLTDAIEWIKSWREGERRRRGKSEEEEEERVRWSKRWGAERRRCSNLLPLWFSSFPLSNFFSPSFFLFLLLLFFLPSFPSVFFFFFLVSFFFTTIANVFINYSCFVSCREKKKDKKEKKRKTYRRKEERGRNNWKRRRRKKEVWLTSYAMIASDIFFTFLMMRFSFSASCLPLWISSFSERERRKEIERYSRLRLFSLFQFLVLFWFLY